MIRFIMSRRVKDINGLEAKHLYTIDIDVPELEAKLNSGGYGENYYDYHELLGVEVLDNSCNNNK